jgi:mannose-1-phosphate guanylyltransferase
MRRAILLAGGRGTRLGSASLATPKCLQRIDGVAILERLALQLFEVGVEEVLINTHHLSELVEEFVSTSDWRERARIAHEPELLGTLGTLRANADFFGDDSGWILHADNYISGSLHELKRTFESRPEGTWGSMLVFPLEGTGNLGIASVDQRGVLASFREKEEPKDTMLASAATFVLDARAVATAKALPIDARDISRDLIPQLIGRLTVCQHSGAVVDIGTPLGLAVARTLAARGAG